MNLERTLERTIEPRRNDEIAESVKQTVKALEDLIGGQVAPRHAALRTIGSELGQIVARNISLSDNPDTILQEISSFWNGYALGDMNIEKGDRTSFTLRNCFECMGDKSTDLLCGFKEGFVNAILNDRTGGIGSVEEVECCSNGADDCRFRVKTVQRDSQRGIALPLQG